MPTPSTQAIPPGMHSVTPHLVCAGAAEAIRFYERAFNAIERSRMPGPGGLLMHAQVQIGDSMVMLVDEFPSFGNLGPLALKGSPVILHLYVPDVDAAFAQAVAAGATALMPPADMFWGDRYGQVQDPFGHRWSLATHTQDMSPQEMMAAMAEMPARGPDCG